MRPEVDHFSIALSLLSIETGLYIYNYELEDEKID
jgi:hypothetical protein